MLETDTYRWNRFGDSLDIFCQDQNLLLTEFGIKKKLVMILNTLHNEGVYLKFQ